MTQQNGSACTKSPRATERNISALIAGASSLPFSLPTQENSGSFATKCSAIARVHAKQRYTGWRSRVMCNDEEKLNWMREQNISTLRASFSGRRQSREARVQVGRGKRAGPPR